MRWIPNKPLTRTKNAFLFLNSVYNKLYTDMASKKPYETKTASIYFEQIQITTQGGTYKGEHIDKVIKVDSTQKAQFDKVFEGLLEIIHKIGKIPNFVILQSPNGYTMVVVRLAFKNEEKPPGDALASSPFRPRRRDSPKRGKKVDKKSGKLRKNKRSKKL
jgi:hypothetical protein